MGIHGYPFPPPLFSPNGIQHSHVVTHTIMMVIAFIHRFESLLKDMTDDTFASHRESLVNQKLELDDSLGDEASRHWNEIASGRARGASPFFSHVREAAFLQRVEKQDLLAWFQEHILGNGNEGAKEGAKEGATGTKGLSVMLFLPHFMSARVKLELPGLEMLDYPIEYQVSE